MISPIEQLQGISKSPVSVLLSGKKGLFMEEDAITYMSSVLGISVPSKSPDYLCVDQNEDCSSIGVEDIEKLISFSATVPVAGDYKIVYIPNFDALTVQAQNKFLKTLEDDTSTVFVGLSFSNASKCLQTIRSRMHIIQYVPYSPDEFKNFVSGDDTILWHAITAGCPGIIDELSPWYKQFKIASDALISLNEEEFLNAVGELREKDKDGLFAIAKRHIPYFFNLIEYSIKFMDISTEQKLDIYKRISEERTLFNRNSYSRVSFFNFCISLFPMVHLNHLP